MYRIALCDDEEVELDKTEQMLNCYEREHAEIEFIIERFLNANNLLDRIRKKNYKPDFIFMDIYMPEKSGNGCSEGIARYGK